MTDRSRHGPLTESFSSAGDVGFEKALTNASIAGWRQQKWHQELEKEWEGRLSDLQQCVCELMIKNQQLRESLKSVNKMPASGA